MNAGAFVVQVGAEVFKRWRATRKAKRAARKGEESDMRFLERLANLRTSTKSGAVGLVPLLLVLLPFRDQAEQFFQQACENPDGVLPFVAGAGVTWIVTVVAARFSKTPAKPGVI